MADKGEKKKAPQKSGKGRSGKKGRTVDKWKKKQWYNIVAPAEFDRTQLGETVAEKPNTLIDRQIVIDLGQLTGQRQKRHISILFKIDKVEGNTASCRVVGHRISKGFLNRLVRRRISKIELVQNVQTSDGKRVKIKSVALSVRKLSNKQQTDIRKKLGELIAAAGQKRTFVQFSQEVIFGAVASKVFKQITKIAPLKRVEIIKSQVLEGK